MERAALIVRHADIRAFTACLFYLHIFLLPPIIRNQLLSFTPFLFYWNT